VIRESINLNRR